MAGRNEQPRCGLPAPLQGGEKPRPGRWSDQVACCWLTARAASRGRLLGAVEALALFAGRRVEEELPRAAFLVAAAEREHVQERSGRRVERRVADLAGLPVVLDE